MEPIKEQVEEIKALICDSRCKYLDAVNKTHFKTLDELQDLTDKLMEICERCPLKKL